MTIPTGTVSLSDLRTELGGSGSQSLKTGSEALAINNPGINLETSPYSMDELRGLANVPPNNISLSPGGSLPEFTDIGGTMDINVTSNTSWDTTISDTWIRLLPESGTGNTLTRLIISPNNESNVRIGNIRYETTDDTAHAYIYISQAECLSPDTPITMADGSIKLLGDIKLGESVLSYKLDGLKDDETNAYTWTSDNIKPNNETIAKVIKLKNGSFKDYYIINDIMKITYEHHVLIRRNDEYKFIPIIDVNEGDYMWSLENGDTEITSKVFVNEPHEFITMDVEETDVYFAHNLLVHNPLGKDFGL